MILTSSFEVVLLSVFEDYYASYKSKMKLCKNIYRTEDTTCFIYVSKHKNIIMIIDVINNALYHTGNKLVSHTRQSCY